MIKWFILFVVVVISVNVPRYEIHSKPLIMYLCLKFFLVLFYPLLYFL